MKTDLLRRYKAVRSGVPEARYWDKMADHFPGLTGEDLRGKIISQFLKIFHISLRTALHGGQCNVIANDAYSFTTDQQ